MMKFRLHHFLLGGRGTIFFGRFFRSLLSPLRPPSDDSAPCAPTVVRPVLSQSGGLIKGLSMNSIIYIVGLVVIVGVILSYFGFR
jgi:hypothetical protein